MKKILRFSMIGFLSLLFAASFAQNPYDLPNPYTGLPFPTARNLTKAATLVIKTWDFDSTATSSTGGDYNMTYLSKIGGTKLGITTLRQNDTISFDAPSKSGGSFNVSTGVWQLAWFHAGSYVRYTINIAASEVGNYYTKIKYSSGSIADRANGDTLNILFVLNKIKADGTPDGAASLNEWYFNRTGDWYSGTTYQGKDTAGPTLNFPAAGTYVLTYFNNCAYAIDPGDINTMSISLSSNPFSGINNMSKNNINVALYPLPCKESLTVSLDNSNKTSNIQINDITGKQVFNNTYSNQNHININTSNLFNGVYFITIKNNEGITTKKFIKM